MKHIDMSELNDLSFALESLDTRIAMESGFINGIANTIRDVVPNLIFGANKIFASIKGLDKYDLRYLDVKMHIMKRILTEDNFVDISGIPVVIPEGMSSSFHMICEAIQKQVTYANNTYPRLVDYSKFISSLISSSDGRRSLKDYSALMKAVDAERETVSKEYANCIQSGSTKSIADYGDVTENNGNWLLCNQILLDTIEKAKVHKVKDIESFVNEITLLLDNLNTRIRSGTVLDMTTETLKSLSAMTVTIAREVEMYAITLYRLSEIKKCYEESCKKLIKSLN